ncbi:hypothetical protein ES319_D11G186100v1 [Gossypium barbadense]|uniref:Uncharacterized protein n=1 Tax=Gossypium barbadense TaxID=3634 RepID=A0A5J5PDH7_GOSBA|nr:hypothetical protein ES319_D11G186100v1 [Gossypium barbadense]
MAISCYSMRLYLFVKLATRKLYDYVQYDLKEIAFPSSLPDPPHIKKRRKLTWHERFLRLLQEEGWRL